MFEFIKSLLNIKLSNKPAMISESDLLETKSKKRKDEKPTRELENEKELEKAKELKPLKSKKLHRSEKLHAAKELEPIEIPKAKTSKLSKTKTTDKPKAKATDKPKPDNVVPLKIKNNTSSNTIKPKSTKKPSNTIKPKKPAKPERVVIEETFSLLPPKPKGRPKKDETT